MRLLLSAGFVAGDDSVLVVLAGDGSDRRFVRVQTAEKGVLAVFPSQAAHGLAEARSCFLIGRHLHGQGIHVPEIFAWDEKSGVILMEDLGDMSLYEEVRRKSLQSEPVQKLYRRVVEELARFQLQGRNNFDPDCCWDTARYDSELMVKRESQYFYREFCHQMLGMRELFPEIDQEFASLAEMAAREPSSFLLHRDFQSRNIMIRNGDIWFIDFQGARIGPLAYDLASLLIDPYVELPQPLQEDLTERYLEAAGNYLSLDRQAFLAGYYYLTLQRNLQMLGAFCFLSSKKGKPFFKKFIKQAAFSLSKRLDEPAGARFPILRQTVAEALERFAALKKDEQIDV